MCIIIDRFLGKGTPYLTDLTYRPDKPELHLWCGRLASATEYILVKKAKIIEVPSGLACSFITWH